MRSDGLGAHAKRSCFASLTKDDAPAKATRDLFVANTYRDAQLTLKVMRAARLKNVEICPKQNREANKQARKGRQNCAIAFLPAWRLRKTDAIANERCAI